MLEKLAAEPVETRSLPASPCSADQVRGAGWRLDDLWLPAVVLRWDALRHNLDRFAAWCAERGLDHAPHGKTTMAPQLWAAQLERGAWGITAATVAQARVMRRFGVPRVLLANEVVEPGPLRWIAEAIAEPGFELLCLVDSPAGLDAMEKALAEAGSPRRLPVLVEIGVAGRRTGVRDRGAGLELAERVAASRWVRLAGIEGFEGVLQQRRDTEAPDKVRAYLDDLAALAVAADERGVFDDSEEVVVTAGGSAYFDLVADAFAAMPRLSRPVRAVLRSGCYLTHDHVSYERSSPLRSGVDPDPLRPALVAYARVLSCPEPGRALLGGGKRDLPYDLDLPVPLAVHREGITTDVPGRARVVELNDHHAFCDHEAGLLAVGDVVELGLSHPCTTFDKWALIPVVDADGRVVDAVRTLF
ncbi:MAG: hypothetical protein GEV03_27295 [Streptosporangiales bacterium]|nr:hypothetical protein [Streptosporangiales bacterium]